MFLWAETLTTTTSKSSTRDNEQGGPETQSQTNSPRLYKLTSNNGVVVSVGVFNVVNVRNLIPRFASSTPLGWSTLEVLSKTR